jgi:DNA-directed RNA polymerase subunit RPC12/RpoP
LVKEIKMPYYKCSKCHHEWEDYRSRKCDWCGAKPILLEEETPLEKFIKILLKDPDGFFKGIGDKKDVSHTRKKQKS